MVVVLGSVVADGFVGVVWGARIEAGGWERGGVGGWDGGVEEGCGCEGFDWAGNGVGGFDRGWSWVGWLGWGELGFGLIAKVGKGNF